MKKKEFKYEVENKAGKKWWVRIPTKVDMFQMIDTLEEVLDVKVIRVVRGW